MCVFKKQACVLCTLHRDRQREAKEQKREAREDKVFMTKLCHSLVIARQTTQVSLNQKLCVSKELLRQNMGKQKG